MTANDLSIHDLMVAAKNNLLTETLINDFTYYQTITNIIRYSTMNQHISNDTTIDNYTANYPPDMDWGSSNTDMSAELTPSNMDDDNFDDEVENPFTLSFNDPSSDTSPTGKCLVSRAGRCLISNVFSGERRPGYRWCCDEWKKHDGNFKKHLNTHNKQVPCEAEPLGMKLCYELFADNKARNRHYWVHHKEYAKKNNIPKEKCFCMPCQTSFVRRDFLRRHIVKRHSKKVEGKEGKIKKVIDDKHEIVKDEDGEYARICRLKNTE
ncbi:hypothetical protein J3F84DRAFT_176610 [Trichoderma pleuroticola]